MRSSYTLLTAFQLAFDSIRAHKLRSFLTLLGVIIGVSSVVLVGAAIEGLGAFAEQETSKAFGTESFLLGQMLASGRLDERARAEKMRRNKPIKKADVDYLKATTGDSVIYSPYQQKTIDIKGENAILEGTSVLGVSAALPEIRDVNLVDGRFFTDDEERRKVQVAVVGDDIRTQLFPTISLMGRTIKISGLDFTIVGLQEKLGSNMGRSQDNQIYIPFTVYARMYGSSQSTVVFGRSRPGSGLRMDDALDISRVSLRNRLRTRPGTVDNFDILTPDSTREFVNSILSLIAGIVIPVTAISLVVGGIVIMNIMLVSVTERTREIGIRKSLGARAADIRLQFLVEAVILSSFGGLLGLAVGALFAGLGSLAFGVKLALTPPFIFLAIAVSSSVGIISGWYPAARASRLDPVVALRAE